MAGPTSESRAGRQPRSFEYVIVGGGNAAGYACREFVAQGVRVGKVAVITAEPAPPYERPALSKAYLHPPAWGGREPARARLPGFHTSVGVGGDRQTAEWYEEKGIELVKGAATSVDLKSKCVMVGADRVGYEKLILATGCSALRVSKFGVKGDDLTNVFYVREESEAAQLVQALEALHGKSGKAVILGGGYIGLECAAALKGWGLDVNMVFPEANVMPRLFNEELGQWLEDEYSSRGIVMTKGDAAVEFAGGASGSVEGVKLKTGATLPCDIAVVGVGAAPNTEYCQGLKMERGGFAVDAFMRTSDPSVYAIGDVCAFPSESGDLGRCEHVDHARKSAAQAVKAAMGLKTEPYRYLPYFYSRIFEYTDAKIVFNFYGDESGECRVCKRGERSIGAVWVKDNRVTGALLMGSPGPSPEEQTKLQELVASRPDASQPSTVFARARL